ncbi:MAG: hypothetical protein HGA61_00615 [Candidatus Moranbacteria bacterium]|nr:hypothetical protein [Candidatus Moranbacteria bacterium]
MFEKLFKSIGKLIDSIFFQTPTPNKTPASNCDLYDYPEHIEKFARDLEAKGIKITGNLRNIMK